MSMVSEDLGVTKLVDLSVMFPELGRGDGDRDLFAISKISGTSQ